MSTQWVLLWALPSFKNALLNCLRISKNKQENTNIAGRQGPGPKRSHDLPSLWILKVHHENLKSSSLSCTTLFSFPLLLFQVTQQKNNQFSKVPLRRSSSTSQKRVQETPPKSKPQTHQRQEEEGERGRRGRLKAAGRGGLGSHVPREYIHAGEIYSTVHLLWLSLSLTHTHTHTHSRTHTFSFHAEAGTHTPKGTHTRTNPVWWNCLE